MTVAGCHQIRKYFFGDSAGRPVTLRVNQETSLESFREVESCGRVMRRLLRYLANLTTGRIILWCYAIWYVVNVIAQFDARPRLWLNSLGLAAIIGTALLISTRASSNGPTELDRWQIFRLYLMPFCVSSFAALIKDANYVLIFPSSLEENMRGVVLITAFVLVILVLKKFKLAKQ
jgi:hypothetical protein